MLGNSKKESENCRTANPRAHWLISQMRPNTDSVLSTNLHFTGSTRAENAFPQQVKTILRVLFRRENCKGFLLENKRCAWKPQKPMSLSALKWLSSAGSAGWSLGALEHVLYQSCFSWASRMQKVVFTLLRMKLHSTTDDVQGLRPIKLDSLQ